MRTLWLVLVAVTAFGCGAEPAVSPETAQPASTAPVPAESDRSGTVVLAFPAERIDGVLRDWSESRTRLRYARGCILFTGSDDGALDGQLGFDAGSYPLGDEEDLDLASIDVERVAHTSALRVVSHGASASGMKRVVPWLEKLGGVVTDRWEER